MKSTVVDSWFSEYDNPQKAVLIYIRDEILESDKRVEECIKWKSPTFTYKGNIASFNPRSKKHASLMFHTGASIPGDFPNFEGTGDVARYIKIESLAHAKELRDEILSIVHAWCDFKDREVSR